MNIGGRKKERERIRVYTAGARHCSHSFRSIETISVVKERHTIDDGWMLLNSMIFCYASSTQYVRREISQWSRKWSKFSFQGIH